MSFKDVIEMALHGRKVAEAARAMGMYQQQLQRFYSGKCLPEYPEAYAIAKESGMDAGEVFKILAEEKSAKKPKKKEKISESFKPLIEWLNPRWDLLSA